jgi:hypothetical protein
LLHDKSGFDLVAASSPMAWMRAFCVAWEGSCSGVFSHPLGHKYETSREEIRLSAQRGASTYHQASDLTPYPGFCRFLIFESKQEFCVRWRLAVMLKLPQFTRTPAPRSIHGFAHAAGIKCFGRNASIGSVNKVSGTLVLILMNFAVFAHYG